MNDIDMLIMAMRYSAISAATDKSHQLGFPPLGSSHLHHDPTPEGRTEFLQRMRDYVRLAEYCLAEKQKR